MTNALHPYVTLIIWARTYVGLSLVILSWVQEKRITNNKKIINRAETKIKKEIRVVIKDEKLSGGKEVNKEENIKCDIIQYTTVQYNKIKYNTLRYSTIQYNAIQYIIIQYNTTQHSAMLTRE